MKKPFLLSSILLLSLILSAQIQTQQGVSYSYNGKNPRTPLPNVTIECMSANNTVISNSTGDFELVFNKLKIGDRIGPVRVKKREMMVFNQQAVDEWSIRKEPLCLILCDANEFERQKQELINIGKHEAQKKYDRQKAKLEKQLEASQIDRTKYEVELDKAWEELDRLHKHIDEYADLFARIDQSEIDTLAQQAMDMFNKGQVDEAVRLFEQGNYLERLKADNRTIQQADQLIENAKQGRANAEKDKEEHLQSLNAQIAAYKVQNEWEKAGLLMKGLADETQNVADIFDYALYSQNQKQLQEAEHYYLQSLEIYRLLAKNNPQFYEPEVAINLNNLANLYSNIQLFDVAESFYKESLEIRKRIAKNNTQAYEIDVASSMNNLALLYQKIQRFDEAESLFKEALNKYRQIAKDDPEAYESYVALVLNNLATLYSNTQQLNDAETMYKEALIIRRRLAKDLPREYEGDVSITLSNLATLYHKMKRSDEAKTMYEEALAICRHLAKDNPQVYESDVAWILNNMGILYEDTKRYDEAETMSVEALEIRKRLAKNNPKLYEPYVAMTLNNLANIYAETQRFDNAEALFLEALEIQKRLAKDNPPTYQPYVASTFYNLASLYFDIQRLDDADNMFKEALKIYQELAKDNPQVYELQVAMSLNNLAVLYTSSQRLNEAEAMFDEALRIYQQLAKDNPQIYESDIVLTIGNQAFIAILMKQYAKAEHLARKGLAIDPTYLPITNNLAAALLFQGKYNEAEIIYRQHKDVSKDIFLQDFNFFEEAGAIPEERKADVEHIKQLLMQ